MSWIGASDAMQMARYKLTIIIIIIIENLCLGLGSRDLTIASCFLYFGRHNEFILLCEMQFFTMWRLK